MAGGFLCLLVEIISYLFCLRLPFAGFCVSFLELFFLSREEASHLLFMMNRLFLIGLGLVVKPHQCLMNGPVAGLLGKGYF